MKMSPEDAIRTLSGFVARTAQLNANIALANGAEWIAVEHSLAALDEFVKSVREQEKPELKATPAKPKKKGK